MSALSSSCKLRRRLAGTTERSEITGDKNMERVRDREERRTRRVSGSPSRGWKGGGQSGEQK